RRTSAAVATSRVGHRQPGPLWSKRKSSRPAHQFALPLKAVKSPHQHGECGNRSTLLKKSKREERKGNRGGNCMKGCMLAVTRCSGGLYQPAETLTHARTLRVGARLPYPLGPPDVFAMAVSVVARAA